MSENSELKQLLLDDGRVTFNNLKHNLGRALSSEKKLPKLQLRYVKNTTFNASCYYPGGDKRRAIIRMSEAIPVSIQASINQHAPQLVRSTIGGNKLHVDPDNLLTSIYDLAIYFIFLHEFYHIFGGHLDYHNKTFNMAYFSENQRASSNTHKQIDPKISFFLELEADNNALYSVLNHLNLESVFSLASHYGEVDGNATHIHQLAGEARAFAFRHILSAVWVVISLLEQSQLDSMEHPQPAARLLSLTSMLMAWYGELTELAEDDNGALKQSLSQSQAQMLSHFLFHVAKPVIVNLWQFPDSETSVRMGFEGTEHRGAWLNDLKALLLFSKVTTTAGKQLESIEAIRTTLSQSLLKYRLFTPV